MDQTKHHVMYVEDEENDVLLLKRALKRAGWDCSLITFSDSDEAMARIADAAGSGQVPNLILVDMKLLGSSGFDLLEWIRKQDWKPRARVVVLSSSSKPDFIHKALEMGADKYLEKPNDFEDLVHICRQLKQLVDSSPAVPCSSALDSQL